MITLHSNQIMEPDQDARFAMPIKFRYWSIPHTHDFYEIFLVAEGTVTHVVNNIRQELTAGTVAFVRPRDVHSFEKNGTADMCYMNVNFRASTVQHAFDYLGCGFQPGRLCEPALPPMRVISKPEIDHMLSLYRRTIAQLADCPDMGTTPVRAFLMEMLLRFFYPQSKQSKADGPAWLYELLDQMTHLDHMAAGVAKMQQLSPVSPEHLSRTFKKYVGKTPTEWVNELRLGFAAHLLRSSSEEITAICYETGFNSMSHFYTLFCKQYGMSPRAYRQHTSDRLMPGARAYGIPPF